MNESFKKLNQNGSIYFIYMIINKVLEDLYKWLNTNWINRKPNKSNEMYLTAFGIVREKIIHWFSQTW